MNAIDMIPAAIMPDAAPLKGAGMSFCSSLSRIAENFPGQPVVIRADKTSSYEKLMSLIDACRTANVWNFSLATKDEKKGQ